ncbi:MAG: hypothetical protein QOD47_185 [Gemmatimonadaceae bacterium]|nr:hypothetical protein [Gemmatimonadaceae bacterium]
MTKPLPRHAFEPEVASNLRKNVFVGALYSNRNRRGIRGSRYSHRVLPARRRSIYAALVLERERTQQRITITFDVQLGRNRYLDVAEYRDCLYLVQANADYRVAQIELDIAENG